MEQNSNIIINPQISIDNNNIKPLFEPRFTTDETELYIIVTFEDTDKGKLLFIESTKKIHPRDSLLKVKTMNEWLEEAKNNGSFIVDMTPWIYYSFDDRYNMIKEYTENFKKSKRK